MRAVFFKLLLFVISIAAALFLLELGLRLVPKYEEPVTINDEPHIRRIYKPGLDLQVRSEDGGSWVRFKTNSYGFQDNEWEIPKKGIRIANNGDSYVAGQIFYEDNFAHQIGKILTEKMEEPVESLSFGVGRQGTDDAYNTYRYYTKLSDPDIVVLWMYMGNDYHDNLDHVVTEEATSSDQGLTTTHEKLNFFKYVIQNSELVQLILRAKEHSLFVQKTVTFIKNTPFLKDVAYGAYLNEPTEEITLIFTSVNEARNEKAVELVREYLTKFRDEVAADGKKFFVFILPIQFQIDDETLGRILDQYPALQEMGFDSTKPRDVTVGILEELSISYYDLTDFFKGECDGQYNCPMYQCRYCHLSARGHRRVAEAASDVLYEKFFKKSEIFETTRE